MSWTNRSTYPRGGEIALLVGLYEEASVMQKTFVLDKDETVYLQGRKSKRHLSLLYEAAEIGVVVDLPWGIGQERISQHLRPQT